MRSFKSVLADPHTSFTHSCTHFTGQKQASTNGSQLEQKSIMTRGDDLLLMQATPQSALFSIKSKKKNVDKKIDEQYFKSELKQFQFTSEKKSQKQGFQPYPSQYPKVFVPVSHDSAFGSRSYITLGYTPKRYATKERSQIAEKYLAIQKEEKQLKEMKEKELKQKKDLQRKERDLLREAKSKVRLLKESPADLQHKQIDNQEKIENEKPSQAIQVELEKQEEPPIESQAAVVQSERSSEVDSNQLINYEFPKETDHPYSLKDPRNLYVQYDNKYKQDYLNKVKLHFNTSYAQNFNKKNTVLAAIKKAATNNQNVQNIQMFRQKSAKRQDQMKQLLQQIVF